MAEKFTLKAGTKLFVGNVAATLAADTEVVFETVDGRDQMAEALAHKPEVYGAHRDELAHEFEDVRDGARVRVRVTYGPHGARSEEVVGPVEEKAEVVEVVAPAGPTDAVN